MSTIIIVTSEGDECELPEGDALTKTLKSSGAKGRFSEKAFAPIAQALGVAPAALKALVNKAKAAKADKEAPLPAGRMAKAANALGISESELRKSLGAEGPGRKVLDKAYLATREVRRSK
jgi:hypothetical protein